MSPTPLTQFALERPLRTLGLMSGTSVDGVDVALLIDAMRLAGIERLAQVDLGVRHHRNRSLDELGPQALAVGQAILDRAGVRPPGTAVLHRPGREPLPVPMHQRPPLDSL